jgi:ATP-dependent exoDNAse (exonuclease V) beta subunit
MGASTVVGLLERREALSHAGMLQTLDAVLSVVGMATLCAEWGETELRRANLDAVRAHAVAYVDSCDTEQRPATLVGLLARFKELATENKREYKPRRDNQAVLGADNAVTVCTWHKSKGLEWPVVVLFGIEASTLPRATGVHVASDTEEFDASDPLAGRWVRYWPNPYHKATRGPVRTVLEQSSEYEDLLEKSQRERLRVLYVIWTRARDRLVLTAMEGKLLAGALGELSAIDETLISEPTQSPAVWAGREVHLTIAPCSPEDPAPEPPTPGCSYVTAGVKDYPPAFIAPSGIEASGTTGMPIHLGDPIEVRGNPNPLDLGNAIHSFLAADSVELDDVVRKSIAEGLLTRWGLSENLDPSDLVAMFDRLTAWIATEWPEGTLHREWPLRHRLEDGSVVRGSLDGFVEAEGRGAVLDHKALDAGVEASVTLAAGYAGQLGAYADGVREARDYSEVRTFVHLPLAGHIVEVHLT